MNSEVQPLPDMRITALAPWFGGKRNLAPLIVKALGRHRVYWELFCGSMAVLFEKEPCSNETVNDLNGDVVNLARVLASEDAHELFGRLLRTTFCEALFLDAKSRRRTEPARVGIDAAYDFFIESWMGRNGVAGTRESNTSFCVRFTGNGGDPAKRFRSAVDSIPAWAQRLRGVWILQRDAFELIERIEDAEGTALYLDPPYIVKGAKYVHDFAPEDHERLAKLLHRFTKARVVLSYYDHPKLAELYPDWTQHKIEVSKALAHQGARGANDTKAVEVLLINESCEIKEARAGQMGLWGAE